MLWLVHGTEMKHGSDVQQWQPARCVDGLVTVKWALVPSFLAMCCSFEHALAVCVHMLQCVASGAWGFCLIVKPLVIYLTEAARNQTTRQKVVLHD